MCTNFDTLTNFSSLPENDQLRYHLEKETADDWLNLSEPGPSDYTNRGQKLRTQDGMRWVYRGKLGAWTERRYEDELREREERRVDALQHASVEALLEAEASAPGGMGGIWRARVPSNSNNKRMRQRSGGGSIGQPLSKRVRMCAWNPEQQNEPLNESDDENGDYNALRASTMAVPLLVPVLSARGLLESKLLKQIFRNPHLTALNRTALNLLENEHVMSCALGRCFGVMERMTGREGPVPQNIHKPENILLEPMDCIPPLAHINNLFVTKKGLTVPTTVQDPSVPENSSVSASTYVISPEEQRDIVYASLKCLNELYADSCEYMERLGEVRMMLAEVRRDRKHVWDMLRRWALKRESQDYQANLGKKRNQTGIRDVADEKSQDEAFDNTEASISGRTPSVPNESSRRGDSASTSNRSRGKKRSTRA